MLRPLNSWVLFLIPVEEGGYSLSMGRYYF